MGKLSAPERSRMSQTMKHLDLFSGIGGFAYAVDQVWPGAEHIFCEIDPFCQAVLKKHWKGAKIYGDIRQLTANTESGQSGQSQAGNGGQDTCRGNQECDLLTGGFPCQPFSQAGKRKGTDDNRYLWPAMFRAIQLTKPRWIIAENVRGLINIQDGVVFGQVLTDLESEGYEVQPFIIPAVAVNAPHRRDRVWIVGNATKEGCGERGRQKVGTCERQMGKHRQERAEIRANGGAICKRLNWSAIWLKVATELCGVDDGLPAELDGLKLSKAGHRVERLKALGNAIVPQVAVEIMRSIKYSDEAGVMR